MMACVCVVATDADGDCELVSRNRETRDPTASERRHVVRRQTTADSRLTGAARRLHTAHQGLIMDYYNNSCYYTGLHGLIVILQATENVKTPRSLP